MSYRFIPRRQFAERSTVTRQVSWGDVRDLLYFAGRRLNEERLPQVAGSLTFTTVLALVPMLTIAFAIFTTFPLFNTFRKSLEAYFIQSLMPQSIANTILGYLNQFANKASRLSAFGAAALIVTAVAMLMMIERVFNQIWKVKASRPFAQRIVVYWAVVTLGPLFIGASISVTSDLFTATDGVVRNAPLLGTAYYTLISILLTTGAFALLYLAVPNRTIDWRDAVCGGLVAATAFEVAKRIFVVFIAKFPTYTVVYGALAAMPIFLVWVYVSWLIILLGAVIVAALPVVKYERWWHVAAPGSAFVDAMSVLGVLHTARDRATNAAVDAETIRARTRLGFDESETLLEKMLEVGWVGRVKTESVGGRALWSKRVVQRQDRWTLLANPHQVTVADVYRMFAFHSSGDTAVSTYVEAVMDKGLSENLASYFAKAGLERPTT